MDIRRYDIIQADLGTNIGSEQGGIRPVLVIQNNQGNMYSSTTIIMPLSSKLKSLNIPTHTIIHKDADNGLKTDSVVLGEQMRVISNQRIIKKLVLLQIRKHKRILKKSTKQILENKGVVSMEYVVMSLEEAKKVAKKNATVLVAKQDLEKDDCNESFSVKKFCDCKNILEEAATIAKVCDNFASQLRVFSDIQEDVINYEKKGILNVILFQSRCNDLE